MGVASGCGEQEVGVASGSGWNLWVWLLGVVLRRYIDFLILLIPTPLVSVLFCSSIPTSFFILYCKVEIFRSCLIFGGFGKDEFDLKFILTILVHKYLLVLGIVQYFNIDNWLLNIDQ